MTGLSLVPLIVSAGVGLAVAMTIAGMGIMRSPVIAARGRVRSLVESDSPYAAGFEPSVRRLGNRRFAFVTEGLAKNAGKSTQLKIDRSGLPLRVGEYVAIRLVALMLGAVGFGFLGLALVGDGGGLAGVLLGVGIGFVAPPLILGIITSRRSAVVETQLVELCELMSSMLRGGYGYVQALATTSEELGAPLGRDLARLVDSVRLGADVDDELARLNDRLGSTDFEMLATAISIQRRSGGNLAEILSGVAETIRYRQSFKREMDALTAQARYSAIIVASIPFVLLGVLSVMDPSRYTLLFTDQIGRLLLGAAIALDIFGYFVIKQVSKVEA